MESLKKSPKKTQQTLNRCVLQGDCFDLMKTCDSHSVNLIYVDPPFLTQKKHKLTNRKRTKTFSFSDIWESQREYATFLFDRLEQCHRVLATTGSLFFHCDKNAVHIARFILDEIFGPRFFRSEIIWTYRRWSNSQRGLLPAHQNILYYTKSDDYTFNAQTTDYSPSTNIDQTLQQRARDSDGKTTYKRDKNGDTIPSGAKHGVPLGDVWDIPYLNPKAKERVGYPTQKPVLLLERIINIGSNVGDVVLDPFCGSGTTLVAAKLGKRNFLGMDISPDACALSEARLANPVKSESNLLQMGRDAYKNVNENAIKYLHGLNFKPVQRNRGIDAILDVDIDGRPVLIRVQRKDELLIECCERLVKASIGKNAAELVVLRTNGNCDLFNVPPESVTVIDAGAYSLTKRISEIGGQRSLEENQ